MCFAWTLDEQSGRRIVTQSSGALLQLHSEFSVCVPSQGVARSAVVVQLEWVLHQQTLAKPSGGAIFSSIHFVFNGVPSLRS